jgi:hypothetical protein
VSPSAAFYCVADARYFLGAAAMINSLRLHGHAEPVFVLDRGLTDSQRQLLAAEATVVRGRPDTPPWLLKTVAPLDRPAHVVVLIDADMIVTRPLAELIERAGEGRVVAFRNDTQRFVPRWGELLELGSVRRGPYVSSGLVFLGRPLSERVLRLMDDRASRVDFELTFWRRNVREYPFLYADQDLLNAILATRVEADRLDALETRLAATPPFRGLRIRDQRVLRCAYRDGVEPYVLHHFHRKPWLAPMRHGIYSRLLSRLLLEGDVALSVPENEIPLRMRRGPLARIERTRVDAKDVLARYLGQPVAGWVRRHAPSLRRGAARWR